MQTSYSTTDNNEEIIVLIIIWKTDPLLFSFSFFFNLDKFCVDQKKKMKNPILETVGWQKMKQPKHYNYCIGKYYANKYI